MKTSLQGNMIKILNRTVLRPLKRITTEDFVELLVKEVKGTFAGPPRYQDNQRDFCRSALTSLICPTINNITMPQYQHLQQAYRVDGHIVPLRLMSREETLSKIKKLIRGSKGSLEHARELKEWWERLNGVEIEATPVA